MKTTCPLPGTYWQRHAEPAHASLACDTNTEVLVVGAGVAGLSTAEYLSKRGKRVVVVDQSYVGSGASGKSSGIISQDSELELADLIRNLGRENAERLWSFVSGGVEAMRDNIKTHAFDCDYQMQDYVFLAKDASGMEKVHREMKSRESLGYPSTIYEGDDLAHLVGARGYRSALRYPGTFGIDSFAYVQGMRRVLTERGVTFYENTPVVEVGAQYALTESGHRIQAEHVVVCVDRLAPTLKAAPRDVYHVETYLTISEPLSPESVAKLFPSGLFMAADSDLIYQYFRLTGDNRLLLGGGDYLTTYARRESNPHRIVGKLKAYAKRHFPDVPITFTHVWPGLLGVSKDLVPLVGKTHKGEGAHFIAACTGLAWGTALGAYVGAKIVDGRSDLDHLFSPERRFPLDPLMRLAQWVITTPMAFGLSHAYAKYLR